jgi:hypothetical protein
MLVLPLSEITTHSEDIKATSVPEMVTGTGMRNGLIVLVYMERSLEGRMKKPSA